MTSVSEQELKDHQKTIGGQRVTYDGLKANIKKVQHIVVPDTMLTICIITLQNGFTVTGESACADPSMFNQEIGERISQDNAEKKIWPLMGYALRQEMYEVEKNTGEPETHLTRLRREQQQLAERIAKLQAFIGGRAIFATLPIDEQSDLVHQLEVMQAYRAILARRIART